jgi:hypothetical protein
MDALRNNIGNERMFAAMETRKDFAAMETRIKDRCMYICMRIRFYLCMDSCVLYGYYVRQIQLLAPPNEHELDMDTL